MSLSVEVCVCVFRGVCFNEQCYFYCPSATLTALTVFDSDHLVSQCFLHYGHRNPSWYPESTDMFLALSR